MSATSPLSLPERVVVVLDVALGVALCAVAAFLLVVSTGGRVDPDDPHGGAFGLLGAVLLGSPGVLFLVAAVGVARRWRGRWWLHLLAIVPALLLALGGMGHLW